MSTVLDFDAANTSDAIGEFVDLDGERFYAIRNVDTIKPFFVSVVSNVDHWLFASSRGGLTAGRVSPDTALLPYVTVDKIHESGPHTGPKTIVRIGSKGKQRLWEPFNREHDDRYAISRHLYKNTLGNKLCFQEINHELRLEFRYTWLSSEQYGFSRLCELRNTGPDEVTIEFIDGLQNLLPAGTPRFAQTNTSNLVDAYKWTELDEQTGMAMFTLYSGITDRAEPCESLKANVAYCLGLNAPRVLLSGLQLNDFRNGRTLSQESHKRGIRGAYFVHHRIELASGAAQRWQIVANIEQSQSQVVALRKELQTPGKLADAIAESVQAGSSDLARIIGVNDGFQATAEEIVSVHHHANVLFNVLRGGYFHDQYQVASHDFVATVKSFNRDIYSRNQEFLLGLPQKLEYSKLQALIDAHGDAQLSRLCGEYLPITFGRRHGDPSRPWNLFSIKLKDRHGDPLLSYEGNWRDIFQNWEALAFSYPEFVETMIAKFVNASTMDGYNPYRITKEGIDWEVEEPDNPWSYIGYWGDHQIIYLQKLLELSAGFHPERLAGMLREPVFSYANVPYRILSIDALLADPKNTVIYDEALAATIEHRVAKIGADGKLVLDSDGNVYQVNLLEKLLVALLAKLGNLVVDGGIWMNTQRPEWNDANNALVGQGLSMVTLCYMHRYVSFLRSLMATDTSAFEISAEVHEWLIETGAALQRLRTQLDKTPLSSAQHYTSLAELGRAASHYRDTVYTQGSFTHKVSEKPEQVMTLLDDALAAIEHSIESNVRPDGMYHAYNTLEIRGDTLSVENLYPMLEGQVAALSTEAIRPDEAVTVLKALFDSSIYRDDQHSFMLYPDRNLPGFLEKNRIPADRVAAIPLLRKMLDNDDQRIIACDAEGQHRFSAEFSSAADLNAQLDGLTASYGDDVDAARDALNKLFEDVFDHKVFTGRSGTMFGFEGLGSVYWHMVGKLLLAVQENYFRALEQDADQETQRSLGTYYYRIRAGLGFNKSPTEYGAFPADPYSHTPKHSGARQPGMTGQVKEEILCRFGELGIRISDGQVRFSPQLLRKREFLTEPRTFCFLDVNGDWQELALPAFALAFTWCQVPVVYQLDDQAKPQLIVKHSDNREAIASTLQLSPEQSAGLFRRNGQIRSITITLPTSMLFVE